MRVLSLRLAVRLGLGLLAGAVLTSAAHAQQPDTVRARRDTTRLRRDTTRVQFPTKPPSDSLLRDSLAKLDSMRAATPLPAKPPKDTIKAPLPKAELPVVVEIGETRCWNREAMFATGELTLQDLLVRVPGVTSLRAGWIPSPMVTSYLGDVARVRLFLDGQELEILDPRAGSNIDGSQVPLFTLEGICIERGAREVRVSMRTWRVNNTTPNTRTDVTTGDQATNLYRAFFGKRYNGGEAFQFAAQQYGTTPSRAANSSDQIGFLARLGWAKGKWSADGNVVRVSRHRGTLDATDFRTFSGPPDSILGVESSNTTAYVRGAYGDPDQGAWAQGIIGFQHYHFTGVKRDSTAADTVPRPSADTGRFQGQYVITGGLTGFGFRLSAAGRAHVLSGQKKTVLVPSARLSYDSRFLSFSAYANGQDVDSIATADAAIRVSPVPFVSFGAIAAADKDDRVGGTGLTTQNMSVEAGVRIRGLWLIGGLVRRDTAFLATPELVDFDTPHVYAPVLDAPANGVSAAIRGTLYKAIKANVTAIRWNDTAGFYRPRYQARSEVYLQSNWLSRFPSGNFSILYSLVHEYRSNTHLPVFRQNGGLITVGDTVVSTYRTLNSLLEIRILSAVAFWDFRNLLGERYSNFPGYLLPRQTQTYGVRWEFWN